MSRRYPEYKPSGIEWIGEVPEHWEVKKLKYVAKDVLTGSTPPTSDESHYEDGTFNWYTPGDFSDSLELVDSTRKINEETVRNGIVKTYPARSILIVGIGATIGKSALCSATCSSNQQVNAVIFNDQINPWYGLFYFRAIQRAFKSLSNSATLPIVNQSQTKDLWVPVPPLAEQKTIAAYLNEKTALIDDTIRKKQRLIELLQEERTALINQAVTRGLDPNVPMKSSGVEWLGEIPAHWELKRLRHLCLLNPSKRVFQDEEYEQSTVFLPMEKVSETGEYSCDIVKPVGELVSGYTYFERGDILVAKITPCFENGKGALLKDLPYDFGFGSTEYHVLRALSPIVSDYLFFLTRSDRFMKIGEAQMTGAAGQKRVPTSFLQNFIVALPPHAEQEQIVHHTNLKIDHISQTQQRIEQEIMLLQEYRTALINEVVTGKRCVVTQPEALATA